MIRDAERKESWDILTSSEEYFRETRKNNVLKYFGKYLIASWDKYIWGYGLRVKQILVTMIIVVVLFALIYFLFLFSSDQAFITKIENSLLTSVNAILIGNLDIDKVKMEKENLFQAVVLVQNGIGILYPCRALKIVSSTLFVILSDSNLHITKISISEFSSFIPGSCFGSEWDWYIIFCADYIGCV